MNRKPERIQKVLAAAGYGSRRACEAMAIEGRVSVNGEIVDELPVLVDPRVDDIRVDGYRIHREPMVYYLLHKPQGVLCTNNDPGDRRKTMDLLKGVKERVYPVGRLDKDSTGLVLMTNDGELAERLAHPRYGVEKTYSATVRGAISGEELEKIRKGVWLSEGKAQRVKIRVVYSDREGCQLEIRLREGRNRQVRQILSLLGQKVHRLKRVRIGPLSLRGLGPGQYRKLTSTEVADLRAAVISES